MFSARAKLAILSLHFKPLPLQLGGVWDGCSSGVYTTNDLVDLSSSVLAEKLKPKQCQQDFTETIEMKEIWEQSDRFVQFWCVYMCVASEEEVQWNKAIITTSWEGVEDGANWEIGEGLRACKHACIRNGGKENCRKQHACHAVRFLGHGSNRVCHSPWCPQGQSSLLAS